MLKKPKFCSVKMRYDPIFRYRGWDRRVFKEWKGYSGLVNDHHVIPKQFKNHPLVRNLDYDINGNFNLIIMPTPLGVKKLGLHPTTISHTVHPRYNIRVKEFLDSINENYSTSDEKEYRLWLLVHWLKENGKFLF